ncbi:heparan-alpha-glucosaminide N-acetyltransferase-like protein, partial [Leptotrombidium deliense]
IFQTTLSHDPEGLLGTLASILVVFFGLQVGKIFVIFTSHRQRLLRWIVWSFLTGIITLCLWLHGSFPISKNLWSLSFVTLSAFLAFVVIIIFYILIDVKCWWLKGAPFHIPGKNSIFLYIGHEVCSNIFPFSFEVDKSSHAWLLFRSLWTTTLWFLVSVIMAKKRIFISL